MVDEKGQLHTIEGFTAAFILVLAMLYGVQSIAITPTSSSTASQEVELNNYKLADDIVASSNSNGELREAILNWNASSGSFVGSLREESYYAGTVTGNFDFGAPVPGGLGETLNKTLTQRGIAYNIDIECSYSDGTSEDDQVFADNGDPSIHSSTGSTTLTLYDYEKVKSGNGEVSLAEVDTTPEEDLGFYCDRMDTGSPIYNTVEVSITIWRM